MRTLLFLGLFWSLSASAFTVTPMSVTFEPSGPGATQSFQVSNTTADAIAVEVSLATRSMDLNGKETQTQPPELEKLFLIFPSQLVLKPGEKRAVRVSYVGSALKTEIAYRLIFEQLPVATEKKEKTNGALIKMLLKYVAAIYVLPPEAKPNLHLKSSARVPGKKGQPDQIELVFENTGAAHRVLSGLRLRIVTTEPEPKTLTLEPDSLPMLEGQNVLAGGTRRFEIPWPAALPKAPFQVSFVFKD